MYAAMEAVASGCIGRFQTFILDLSPFYAIPLGIAMFGALLATLMKALR